MIGITGGYGVLGSILTRDILKDASLYKLYDGDVRDDVAMEQWLHEQDIDILIFLASKVAVNEVNANRINAYDVNVNGIIQTLKAIRKRNKSIYFFYASTSHVYKSSDLPIKEDDPIRPLNTYGMTKYLAECLLTDYANAEPNFKLCIGRIFSFFHESQKKPYLYPSIKERLETEDLNVPFKLMGALSERDFQNAEVVCQTIMDLVAKKVEGVYNIGSGVSIKIKDFVQSLIDRPILFDIDPSEKRAILVADISKLKSVLHEL